MDKKKISIGFIPLREYSMGIPGKNRKKFLGRPLFTWVLSEAIFSSLDHIYLYTDDEIIMDYVARNYKWTEKVSCIIRPKENAVDTPSTETAIMQFLKETKPDFDIFCLLQATSPLTRRSDIDKALELLGDGTTDAVLSVVNTRRFIWSKDGKSLNYDYRKRPGRHDFDGLLIENGAVYASVKAALETSGNRISGKIAPMQMPEESLVEIDSESDWALAEQLMVGRLKNGRAAARIEYIVLDVDGVFSDGKVVYGNEGEFSKTFDMRDGMGLEIIREHGIKVMVMTSEDSAVVSQRMKKLKIEDTFLGVKDKFSFLEHICAERGIKFENLAYIGDDVNDMANMLRAGWAFCPANATKTIKYLADLVLNRKSADGAIREATDFIMNYNKRFDGI